MGENRHEPLSVAYQRAEKLGIKAECPVDHGERSEEMQKRAYFKPKMVRVKLNPEQAVLSQCSGSVGTLATQVLTWCHPGDNCRQTSKKGGSDETFSS